MQPYRYVVPLFTFPYLRAIPQLHFALNDATHWESPYNGFNYEEFYEFIIDFFEADKTPEGKAASHELLIWWNRYVHKLRLLSLLKPLQARVSAVCRHPSSLIQIRKAIIPCGPTTTTPSRASPKLGALVYPECMIQ